MSALNDCLTYREVTHEWDTNVREWETEHHEDDDVLQARAATQRLETVKHPFRAPQAGRSSMLIQPFGEDGVYRGYSARDEYEEEGF